MTGGLTAEDRRRAAAVAESQDTHESGAAPFADGGGGDVPPETCAAIRRERRDGTPTTALAERFGLTRRTVRYHARGECDHDPGEPADEARRGRRGAPEVPAETCEEWRRVTREVDAPAPALAERDGWAAATVRRHVRGECDHDHDEPPAPRRGGGA